jgi:hypothetical protein
MDRVIGSEWGTVDGFDAGFDAEGISLSANWQLDLVHFQFGLGQFALLGNIVEAGQNVAKYCE